MYYFLREIFEISRPILFTSYQHTGEKSAFAQHQLIKVNQLINSEEQREKRRLETRDSCPSLYIKATISGRYRGDSFGDRTRIETLDIYRGFRGSRGRKNTDRIAGRNLYRPATREWLLLDESPAKSCERYSRKSMTKCVYPFDFIRDRDQSRYFGDTFTRIFSSLSST